LCRHAVLLKRCESSRGLAAPPQLVLTFEGRVLCRSPSTVVCE
jgi:hypothetical protein